ncbi:hypothetical protein H6G33_01000 [Calothrix sp. FACHB-1219]|uniref:hypothetical protein n=1 Tax=unclassified Calothrix TaxID=2619626 RepID=UPI0016833288|nr:MULTISPECIES: hypothetical protein [unclassified Calothrix]MBD2201179.1 hypothetical protein [Calothrix sp. FACHB-168]MBD2215613.1 hypothetical protein [Calothrix sp. FACHB-1219]
MSLGIIIPLKSKQVSKSWETVSNLLACTLQSIQNQSYQDYHAVVIGHDRPDLSAFGDHLIDFLFSEFEIPPLKKGGSYSRYSDFDRILDKYRKIALGYQFLKSRDITYFMVLDADDLIHQDLTRYIFENYNSNGFILKNGYQYFRKNQKVVNRTDLDKICGSTTIIHANHIPEIDIVNDQSLKLIPWCFLCHSQMESYFSSKGTPLKNVDFPSLMYVYQHNENCSNEFVSTLKSKFRQQLKIFIHGHYINDQIKLNFALK